MSYAMLNQMGSILQGAGTIIGGIYTAQGDAASAAFYKEAAAYTALNTKIQAELATRQGYQAVGQNKAAVAGNGFTNAGTANEFIRATGQQAGMTRAVGVLNGVLQQQSYEAQASAAESASQGALFGGIVGGIGQMFSDDRLKQNIKPCGTNHLGIGIFRFNLIGSSVRYEGALASDVLKRMPAAVSQDADGMYLIDYDMIDMKPRIVGDAGNS